MLDPCLFVSEYMDVRLLLLGVSWLYFLLDLFLIQRHMRLHTLMASVAAVNISVTVVLVVAILGSLSVGVVLTNLWYS